MGVDKDAIAARLRAVMGEFATSYQAMAILCGTSKSVINQWVNKGNLPPVPKMCRLSEQTGITLDWLYRGTMEPMNPDLYARLGRRMPQSTTINESPPD